MGKTVPLSQWQEKRHTCAAFLHRWADEAWELRWSRQDVGGLLLALEGGDVVSSLNSDNATITSQNGNQRIYWRGAR